MKEELQEELYCCEDCGEPAELKGINGWWSTLCGHCRSKRT